MTRSRVGSLVALTVSISLSVGCVTGGRNWADEKKSLSGHNTPKSWVRTPPIADVNASPEVTILRQGRSISFKSFADALRSYRDGDEVRLGSGTYPFAEEVRIPTEVSRVLISGQGIDSVVVFARNVANKSYNPHLITHAPITFRDIQIVGPKITSTTSDARLWFEGAYASGRFEHFGRELMGGASPEVFVLSGYYSPESSFGKAPPPEFVMAFQPAYMFSVSHTPYLAMENSHYAVRTLRNIDSNGAMAPALHRFGQEIAKLWRDGGYALPPEATMTNVISEIYRLTREQRLSLHPSYGPRAGNQANDRLTLEAYSRLANYLFLKTGAKSTIELAPQVISAIDKSKSALRAGAPAVALLLATQYDIPRFHPRYKEFEGTVSQALNALQSQHGCKITIRTKGPVSNEDYRPQSIVGWLRLNTATLYPVAYINNRSANGCEVVTDVYKSVFSHWQSDISANVTTTLVETDESRRAREAALAANSRDVWKEAFSSVGNAAMRAGERSRQVWQNHEKTRTRVEERGSGTYLIYYKGNLNLPPPQIAGGASAASKTNASGGAAPSGMREKTTVRKRYYLYGSHEVDYEINITDGGRLVTKFERTKHRTESKRGPCESESVDGWSATILSGDCYVTGLPRSGEIGRAMNAALVAYLTTNRLPKVVQQVREMYAKNNRLLQAEAALLAALYGGLPEGKGLEAIKAETNGVYRVPAASDIPTDLSMSLYSASTL